MNYQELKKTVAYHCEQYYDYNTPIISDLEFDKLYDQLIGIEKHQGWADFDSPTLRIGGKPGKVKHIRPLYSLKKTYDKAEVDTLFTVETPKIDGANVNPLYIKGKLKLVLTRGDGEFGEDVTHLAKYITDLPLSIQTNVPVIPITGECVTLNKVENFRNYVSGALGLLDEEEFKTRQIAFIAHDWLGTSINYTNRMSILKNMGFKTVLEKEYCSQFPQDGLVYRLDSQAECERLGYTSKYPRFAIALKERGVLTAETTLQDVLWVIGRTGTVNPVGIVSPVILDGATITRVTLHNLDFILSHSLGLGDTVEIERAGGIIPKLVRVVTHATFNSKIDKRHAELAIGEELRQDGPRLLVSGASQHTSKKLLEHFIKTLGIKGLGSASITKLGLIHPSDLYQPQQWQILGANGSKIEAEIERSKTKPYSLVLAAIGIPGVGESTAKRITLQIPTFERLRDVETIQIEGIGPKTIESILAWLDVNEDWVEQLPLQLVQNESVETVLNTSSLKKVCITGKLDMTRGDLAEILSTKGFVVKDTVTKDCYALITAGDISSTKYNRAQELSIKIIDYWTHRNDILAGQF